MATSDTVVTILGGNGMLGSDLSAACHKSGFGSVILDLPDFDITNDTHLRRAVGNSDVIINCAAYTNVDGAESQAELAYQVNAEAIGRLGALARNLGRWVMHISTDFVFDGRSDKPYIETDPPNPINTYGKTKLEGEQLLAQSGCRHCIIRVEWTYGSAGNNFVTKLLKRARAEKVVKVVDDQVGSPTATTEVAAALCKLLPCRPEGLFHFAASGYVSRYGMAEYIFETLPMDVELRACKTSDFASPAARPLSSRFDCSKIQALLDEPVEPWQVPLEDFLRRL